MSLRPQTCTSAFYALPATKHSHKVASEYEAMLEAKHPGINPISCHCYSEGLGLFIPKIPSCQIRIPCYPYFYLHPTHEVYQMLLYYVRRSANQSALLIEMQPGISQGTLALG